MSVHATAAPHGASAGQARGSVDISVDQHFSKKVYSTGSRVTGRAVIRTTRDMPFDAVDISLVGAATTRLDYVQSIPAHASRTFLRLRMPLDPSALPESRVFRAGVKHEVPFTFVVPEQLTLGACSHKCAAPAVRDQHLRLPPSVGCWDGNDQAPEMVRVQYAVRARVLDRAGHECLPQAQHVLKVIPTVDEDAPLDIAPTDERYTISKTKTLRKSLFAGKAGKLTV
jgi:hypothetical protein